MDWNLVKAVVSVSALLGPLSHYGFWVRYDLILASHILLIAAATFPVLLTVLLYGNRVPVLEAFALSLTAESSYLLTLFLSIAVYRLLLHPTRIYGGPAGAKLSALWRIKAFVNSGYRGYILIDELHKQHGDVVRTGPYQLSINHVDAITAIHGPASKCSRLASNEAMRKSLQSIHDKAEHKARRNVWEHGLNARVCQEYLPRIHASTETLISRLMDLSEASDSIVINQWCRFYTFDIMGDLGFGRSYNQLATGRPFPALSKIDQFMWVGSLVMQVPWMVNLMSRIPGVEDPVAALHTWAEQVLRDREETPPKSKDLMSYILGDQLEADPRYKVTRHDIAEDAVTLQIAGADTSYSVLVNLVYYLARYQDLQSKLRSEILSSTALDGATRYPNWSTLSQLQLLDSVITETMRLHPPVPQGQPRESPPYPINIAGYNIPSKTIVSIPIYSLHTDERHFVDPLSFRPERWTTNPELIRDKRAWVPFSFGPMNCVGKYLAIMEIKVFVARVVSSFKIAFAEGENEARKVVEGERDYFTLWVPDLKIRLTKIER